MIENFCLGFHKGELFVRKDIGNKAIFCFKNGLVQHSLNTLRSRAKFNLLGHLTRIGPFKFQIEAKQVNSLRKNRLFCPCTIYTGILNEFFSTKSP